MTLKAATVFVVRMEIANGGPGSLNKTFVWCTTTALNLDIQILLRATNASVVRESMCHQDDAYVYTCSPTGKTAQTPSQWISLEFENK